MTRPLVLGLTGEVLGPVATGDPEMRLAAANMGLAIVWIGT